MSIPCKPSKALLFSSIIFGRQEDLENSEKLLAERIGTIDYRSDILEFDKTDYYNDEMGKGLKRIFLGFSDLLERDRLADIKLITNDIEKTFLKDGSRRVNIDPGLLTLENIVLATGKNFSHRIYVGKGIFAEITLMYTKGDYEPLGWTYPDYATAEVRRILNGLREKYRELLR